MENAPSAPPRTKMPLAASARCAAATPVPPIPYLRSTHVAGAATPPALLSPRRAAVAASTTPVTASPFAFWNVRTSVSVAEPNTPSAPPNRA